jgi:hypothetical protein
VLQRLGAGPAAGQSEVCRCLQGVAAPAPPPSLPLVNRGTMETREPRCMSFGGLPVDAGVVAETLRVVQPAALRGGRSCQPTRRRGTRSPLERGADPRARARAAAGERSAAGATASRAGSGWAAPAGGRPLSSLA